MGDKAPSQTPDQGTSGRRLNQTNSGQGPAVDYILARLTAAEERLSVLETRLALWGIIPDVDVRR